MRWITRLDLIQSSVDCARDASVIFKMPRSVTQLAQLPVRYLIIIALLFIYDQAAGHKGIVSGKD